MGSRQLSLKQPIKVWKFLHTEPLKYHYDYPQWKWKMTFIIELKDGIVTHIPDNLVTKPIHKIIWWKHE